MNGGHSSRPPHRVGAHELTPLLDLWRQRGQPDYHALAERLRLLVLDGRLPVPCVLPSERRLATVARTSRTTTTAAYRALRESGFAESRHGAGTWTSLPREPSGPADDPWPVSQATLTGQTHLDLASAAPAAPAELHAAYAAALEDLPRHLPGHGYVTAGVPELREQVARRYTRRGLPTAADQILITSGAVQGLRLALSVLADVGDRVLVEHPTYPLALDTLKRSGLRPVGWPMEDGWDVAAARRLVRAGAPRLAYLMPDFHNPTGRLLDADARARLATVLADGGCVALVDETTAELDLRNAVASAPAPLAAFSRPGAVICLGSASKVFWGGLRVGWIRAEAHVVRRLALARALDDLAGPPVEQLATAHLLEHVEARLPALRADHSARRAALQAAIAEHLPTWEAPDPDGGLVLWCRLPEPRSSALAGAVRGLGLSVTPGPRFGAGPALTVGQGQGQGLGVGPGQGPGQGLESRLRLPFTRPIPELQAAVRILATAWSSGAAGGEADDTLV